MGYFPIFLELKGRPCLVIGGGAVAAAKAKALLAAGAKVRVVSPALSAGMRRLVQAGKVRWHRKEFAPSDLAQVRVVVAATDDQAVNKQAAREAKRRRIWINVVDQPGLCSFILPSVVRRGALVLAISTSGVSPALAKWIRRDLERRYSPGLAQLLKAMAQVRGTVKRKIPSPNQRKKVFEEALRAYMQVIERMA